MKKFLLLQFFLISLCISGLQISATTAVNIHESSIYFHLGINSRNGVNYFNPYGQTETINCTKYFENSQDPQKVSIPKKQAVRNLDEAIAAMLSSSNPEVIAEGKHLKSLAYDLNPTIFLRNGNLSNPGESVPKCVDSDASSVWKLYEDNPQFNLVELITIRIEKTSDLATIINLTSFQDFVSLKYIYFLCTFEICSSPGCEATSISQIVQVTDNSDALILYLISIPE